MPRYSLVALQPVQEFVTDPALTIACLLLIFVSIAWIVVARLIYLNLKRAAFRRARAHRQDPYSM
jgi:hypothetical protein